MRYSHSMHVNGVRPGRLYWGNRSIGSSEVASFKARLGSEFRPSGPFGRSQSVGAPSLLRTVIGLLVSVIVLEC